MNGQVRRGHGAAKLPLLVGVALVMIALAVVYPLFAQQKEIDRKAPCLSNVKQSNLAMLMYNADYDDRYPDRDRWMELIEPYAKNENMYHCPDCLPLKKEIYGYALNSWLGPRNAGDLVNPALVPAIYDSINFAKNASDPFLSFPEWPTGKEKPRRNLAYADGHAKFEGPSLKGWKP